MSDIQYIHTPVLWKEVLHYVKNATASGTGMFVDCTLGEGGHSELLLKTYPDLQIIAFERDPKILTVAQERLAAYSGRIRYINENFSAMGDYIDAKSVNYILYDFGISSFHYASDRGFGFATDGDLDMRLDDSCPTDASVVVNTYREEELADIIYTLGEERWSRKIASRICEYRKTKKIETTQELADIVLKTIPRKFQVKNIHPATRVFQALRIHVNDELSAIKTSLRDAHTYLAKGGLLMAISFHSLEDRIVKDMFRRLAKGCFCDAEVQYCRCQTQPEVKLITKKPLTPGEEELRANNRSRSSKMRICEKL